MTWYKRSALQYRAVFVLNPIWLVIILPQIGWAGPMEDFYALEEAMADAQEAYLAALEAAKAKDTEKAVQAAKRFDRRTEILKRMDALAAAAGEKPDGAKIAAGAFEWSWNLDLDLENLVVRFEHLTKHYPNSEALDDVLNTAAFAAEEVGPADRWQKALTRLVETTERRHTKLAALAALGQVQLATKHLTQAKATFKRVLESGPKSEFASDAKGAIFEIKRLQVGMVAPDFTTKTLDGKEVSLASLRGKVVLLNFWATW